MQIIDYIFNGSHSAALSETGANRRSKLKLNGLTPAQHRSQAIVAALYSIYAIFSLHKVLLKTLSDIGRVFVKQYWFSRKTKAAEHRQICLPYTKYAFANLPCSAAYFSRENCFAPQKDEICADLQVLTTRNTWLYSEEECLHKMCKDRSLKHYCFMNIRPLIGGFAYIWAALPILPKNKNSGAQRKFPRSG